MGLDWEEDLNPGHLQDKITDRTVNPIFTTLWEGAIRPEVIGLNNYIGTKVDIKVIDFVKKY